MKFFYKILIIPILFLPLKFAHAALDVMWSLDPVVQNGAVTAELTITGIEPSTPDLGVVVLQQQKLVLIQTLIHMLLAPLLNQIKTDKSTLLIQRILLHILQLLLLMHFLILDVFFHITLLVRVSFKYML